MSGSSHMSVSARAEFEWILDGKRDRRDAMDAHDIAFESVDVVRVPASWQHKRNYEGYYWAATAASHVWFESLYERAALVRLDRDRRVAGLAAQPMWIHWPHGAGKHAPDFFVRYDDGSAALIDVRPAERIGDDDAEVFRRTAEVCERLGWGYAVVSDISVAEHRSLRFLSGYRYDRWISAAATARICAGAGERRTLGGVGGVVRGRMRRTVGRRVLGTLVAAAAG